MYNKIYSYNNYTYSYIFMVILRTMYYMELVEI